MYYYMQMLWHCLLNFDDSDTLYLVLVASHCQFKLSRGQSSSKGKTSLNCSTNRLLLSNSHQFSGVWHCRAVLQLPPQQLLLKASVHQGHRHLFLVKKNIPRYYIYHKVRNRSFVKNRCHCDFHVQLDGRQHEGMAYII